MELLCRTCLFQFPTKDLETTKHNIFQSEDLFTKLSEITCLQLEPNDKLPNNVCDGCYQRIKDIHDFVVMSNSSMKKLENMLNEADNEQMTEIVKIEVELIDPIQMDDYCIVKLEECPSDKETQTNLKSTPSKHKKKSSKKVKSLSQNHICEVCGHTAKSSACLKVHMYKHQDSSQYAHACLEPNCNKRFFRKSALTEHVLRHKGEKNFVCSECGFRFISSNEMKKHINNIHTKLKKYICHLCNQEFQSSKGLRQHIRSIHCQRRDYTCQYCEKTFVKRESWQQHEMIHTGEKPQECPECGKRFIQRSSVQTHRKEHYPNGNVPPLPVNPSKRLICNRDLSQVKDVTPKTY